MQFIDNLIYAPRIEPTRENAIEIQRLTLQDVLAGRFDSPLELANPSSHRLVTIQHQKLMNHPERYSGYMRHGKIVAYMKQSRWGIADEYPFASRLGKIKLRMQDMLLQHPTTKDWGIFGLVASDELNDTEREEVLQHLLQRVLGDKSHSDVRAINVVIHEHDPLLTIASRLGFQPDGVAGEAAGAPGLMQQRYRRQTI